MKRLMLALLRFYRRNISPLCPGKCRFVPTCSEYAVQAIPFNHGDHYDPIP